MKKPLLGMLFGTILTTVFLWPILTNFSTHLSSRQDGLLVAWLIDWGSTALLTGQNFFTAPFFHPNPNTVAYADLFFSTAVFNLPLKLIGSTDLIINHNLHLVVGSIIIFLGQYYLGKEIFKKDGLAVLSGVVFAFSHLHLDYMAHLHVFLLAGLPWSVYFWLKFVKTSQAKYLFGLTLAGLYQFLNSPMSGYFILVVTCIFLLFHPETKNVIKKQWSKILPWLIGSAILIGFFYWPYWQIATQFHFSRTIRDAAHFAFGLEKFLEVELIFWGAVLLTLFATLKKKTPSKDLLLFSVIAIAGAVLMLGPALKFQGQTLKVGGWPIPMPYSLAYYLVPGLKAFRATSRFVVVLGFGLSLLIPQLLLENKWLSKLKSQTQTKTLWLLVFLITISLWAMRLPKQRIFAIPKDIPPIYNIIATRPETVLAEFPTYVWSQTTTYYHEADRLYYQSFHGKKLYNGFSGFAPPELENRWHTISNQLETPETIKHLHESEVELVLLHLDEQASYNDFKHPAYELIACQNQDCLYQLK